MELKTRYLIDLWKEKQMTNSWHKEVAGNKQRKHTLAIALAF